MIKQDFITLKGQKIKDNPYPHFNNTNIPNKQFTENFPEELKNDLGVNKKILPYTLQNNFIFKAEDIEVKTIILENDNLKAIFLPEYGGKLYSLYDKRLKKELLFKNQSIMPYNIGLRYAWFAGGIEWNVGNYGHCYTTYDNVFCAILKDNDGNDFLRIYEFERLKSIFWQIDFHLPPEATELICYTKLVNPFNKDTTVYYWANTGLPYKDNMRALFSGNEIIHRSNGRFAYSKLPHTNGICYDDKDITYPKNIDTMIFEYYVQNDTNHLTPWQMAIYPNSHIFYEMSTPKAYCKKLFHWGEYTGGKNWQKLVGSDKNNDKYIEFQTGIAPSQFHDMLFPANSTIEWAQFYGAIQETSDFTQEYSIAQIKANDLLKETSNKLQKLTPILQELSQKQIEEKNIIHYGSGFGYIELKRIELDKDGYIPTSIFFPESGVRPHEAPWLHLLSTGQLKPHEDLSQMSYMTSNKWLPHLETAIYNNPNWFTYYHYGIMALELEDFTKVCSQTYNKELKDNLKLYAYNMFKKSIDLNPTHYTYLCLAMTAAQMRKPQEAKKWWNKILESYPIKEDYCLLKYYFIFLYSIRDYEEIWKVFCSIKEETSVQYDEITIYAAHAAVHLKKYKFLEQFFKIKHFSICEGSTSLIDLWYAYQTQLECDRLNTTNTRKIFDQIKNRKPPENIDYRFGIRTQPKYIFHN